MCKTRSWQRGPRHLDTRRIDVDDENVHTIVDMYANEKGCVAIAMATGVALSSVVDVVRATVNDGRQLRM